MSDCKEITDMYYASFKKVGKGKIPDAFLDEVTPAEVLIKWQNRVSDKSILTLVAEEEGKILGCVCIVNFLKNAIKKRT